MATLEDGVGIDVDHFDRGQGHGLSERPQLREHLLAEMAVAPVHDGENGALFQCGGGEWANGPPGSGPSTAGAGAGAESDAFSALTESAMNRTVSGGTSPTAVTLWPSTTVEKAYEEPTRADSVTGAWPDDVDSTCFSTNTDTDASPSLKTR